MSPRRAIAAAMLAGALLPARPTGALPAPAGQRAGPGAAIYLEGTLGSGAPLTGTHQDGLATSGAGAACVNCHQRSGLGTTEGRLSVPPVTGDYLFSPRAGAPGDPALPYVETVRGEREPYTEATLARAIREGIDPDGRPLHYLMPRFALGDRDMAALVAYLRGLGAGRVPGVTEDLLHFATIVTPDADPLKRRGMLAVLEGFFAKKNLAPLKPSPAMRTSGRTQFAKSMYMANRRWRLHVWTLAGPASTWRAQLEAKLAAEPVYAILSGIGGSQWAPVHEFCERNAIPCLFPNVEVPVVAEHDFYPLYFSKGVLLEAQLMARAILGADRGPSAGAVEQIYRAGDSGERAAGALAALLEARGVAVRSTVLPAKTLGQGVAAALRRAARGEAGRPPVLVLWLRPEDVAALGEVPEGAEVYLSGLMGGLERSPLPAGWRERTRMTYPFDPPDRRGIRLDYPLVFFRYQRIPLVAEQVQADTYLACSLLGEVLNRMADNFARPYLIEQLQGLIANRLITGYYPRLSLATNQRFASKGGYLVRFRDRDGPALAAPGDLIVP